MEDDGSTSHRYRMASLSVVLDAPTGKDSMAKRTTNTITVISFSASYVLISLCYPTDSLEPVQAR